MNVTRYPITATLLAPLHHGAFGADTGNSVLHRRVALASLPSSHPGVPAVSGNALRGALRRIVMRDLFDLVGLGPTTCDPLSLQQWDKLYAALANGGHLSAAETKTYPERIRALRDQLPALSVLGAAIYNAMIPGRVSIGWLWPRCRETVAAGLAPSGDDPTDLLDAELLLTEISLVRHVDRDEHDPVRSGVTPMPITVEALMPGVTLHAEIVTLTRTTAIEIAAIGWALSQLVSLGGKSSGGFGRLGLAHGIDVAPYLAWRADAVATTGAKAALLALAQEMA